MLPGKESPPPAGVADGSKPCSPQALIGGVGVADTGVAVSADPVLSATTHNGTVIRRSIRPPDVGRDKFRTI